MNADSARKRTARGVLLRERRRQALVNAKVFRVLRQQRDDMKTARQFLHFAYFRTKTARDAFLRKVKRLGYGLIANTLPFSKDELPHGVEFARVDAMDATALAGSCAELSLLASRLGGEYDGWEVEVERKSRKR